MKKTIASDVITPILAYKRMTAKNKMILESIPRDSEDARYSIIAFNPVEEIKFQDGILTANGRQIDSDPLDYLNQVTVKASEATELPFQAGAIGFVGYDMISLYEAIGDLPKDTIGTPDMHFFLYESFIVFDHKLEQLTIVEESYYSGRDELDCQVAVNEVYRMLSTSAADDFAQAHVKALDFKPHLDKEVFKDMVDKARDYIRQGDMFQCVLSQRFSADFTGNPFDYYRALRISNPSNYLYFLDFDEYQIVGASPESLVSVKQGTVVTNPIAGTRPRGKDIEEDKALADSLLADPKEVSEHQMLVDLGRNDIGRIAKVGTVEVSQFMTVEYFRYVMHLTSIVKGDLQEGLSSLEALKAVMPAGTVSGAPKIRAMKRIYELEKEKRGIYAGAVGYLSASGDMDFAIAIRTMVIKDGRVYAQAGAGIVYDSVPENEYQETLNKAKLLMRIGD